MAQIVVPVASAVGEAHGETLRFLRAEMRKRHVWGSFSTHAGGGSQRFVAGYRLGVDYYGKRANVTIGLLVSPDKSNVQISVREDDQILTRTELSDFANSMMLAAIDAARIGATRSFWVRRHALYVGRPLPGWYELPGFRVGPASLEVRNDPSPNSNQHLQVVVLDVDVDGIDNYEAIQRSLQQSTRAIAHAAFFLNVALQWPSSFPAVLSESSERLNAVTQWAPPPVVVPYNSLPFSDPLRRGRWGSDFTFTWRDPEQPSVVNGPLFPLSAVAVLRRVRKKDAIADAFDSCTRLYHLSQLVPGGFLSAAAALKIASIDALAQGLPEFCTERGDRARFTSFMTQHGRTSASDADRLYKRWRSAILHAGRFARIDGAYAHIDFIDDAMESEELQRVPETIRWAYAGWVASVASDVPSST